jgi:hypothetical protein
MTRVATMHRFAVLGIVFVGACFFDADYGAGGYRCSDGRCPSGLVCDTSANRCVTHLDGGPDDAPGDASDAPIDAADAMPAALTCVDPGVIAMTGGTATGTTVGRTSTVSSMCGGSVMNGNDAVYRVTAGAGDMYLVSITGVKAYVIIPCSIAPATPACIGNVAASPGNPISFTATAAGQHFIVVDHENPATSAAYTLTVTKQ